MKSPTEMNCIDIVRPYVDAVTAEGMPPVQLLGGVGSVALLEQRTVIKSDERRIIAPADLSLSNYREDGNLRDVETLVLSANPEHIHQVKDCAEEAIEGKLLVDVFGFGDIARAEEMASHPFGKTAVLKTWLSDRYMPGAADWEADGPEPRRMLFPFSTTITAEALEPWTLEVDDRFEIPVPSPGATVVNYLTRSISGLRTKDTKKVQQMASAIFEKSPEQLEWITKGPGSSQFEMVRVFHTLRESKRNPRVLAVGGKLIIAALQYEELMEHQSFMLQDADQKTQSRAIKVAAFKSRGLHALESMDFLVTFFQKHIEPRVSSIVHNK